VHSEIAKADDGLFVGNETCHVEVPPGQRSGRERNNLTQFRIKHLMLMVLSFAFALGIREWISGLGTAFLILVFGYWVGFGFVVVSDLLDARAFEERSIASSTLAGIGIFLVAAFGGMAVILFSLCVVGVFIEVMMG
jgi:hypothetical protein